LPLEKLEVFRPATIDLLLTKMARGDEQDIGFLLTREPLPREELQAAFERARVPDVTEIRELFVAAQPKVLKLARSFRRNRRKVFLWLAVFNTFLLLAQRACNPARATPCCLSVICDARGSPRLQRCNEHNT
jgi:hypothetical protein